jgi:hypothetical protein
MTYREALAAMIQSLGKERMYWDGSFAWMGSDLLEAGADVEAVMGDCEELDGGGYVYYLGKGGDRPGVYRLRGCQSIEPEPVVEVVK